MLLHCLFSVVVSFLVLFAMMKICVAIYLEAAAPYFYGTNKDIYLYEVLALIKHHRKTWQRPTTGE